ncbi:MAG: ATP synthase F1 subunit delta [Acidobacteria bacterium]|nr:MAG: ATP synthase F1 subunit delta [Acidobacteriota bacterium]
MESTGREAGRRWRGIVAGEAAYGAGPGSFDQQFCEELGRDAELKSASLQYANALADIALAQGAAEPTAKQLNAFEAAYAQSAELRTFLASPAVTVEAKHAVLEKITGRLGASKMIRNFLFVIADHRRTQLIPEIVAALQQILRQRQGVAEAEISSAVELSAAQKKELAATLARLTGKKIETKYSLDPELLGGAVVRIGDTIYDGSLRSRLNEMRIRLAAE